MSANSANFRKSHILLRFAAAAAFATLALCASAEPLTEAFVAEHGALKVARVQYRGNARTHDSAIAELAGIRAGEPLSAIDVEAVRQKLLKSGIFSEVGLEGEVEDEGVSVTVTVAEKWTLIPVPSGYYGSGGWGAGLYLIEFNFLGLRKTLALAASDSNLGLSGTIAYVDPRFLGTMTSFKAFASYVNGSEEARLPDGTPFASFAETTANAGLYVEYPSESALRADVELTLCHSGVSAADVDANPAGLLVPSSLALIPGAGLTYDGQRFTGYHLSGPTANVRYTHGISYVGLPSYDTLDISASELLGTFWDGLFTLGFAGRCGDQPFQNQGSLSGPGFRTLPQGDSYSSKDAAAYASLDLPFVKASWCVMTAGAFYEGGAYATGPATGGAAYFHGPGLSYRLYLHDIALPAVGIDAAFNVPTGAIVYSVNVGLSL